MKIASPGLYQTKSGAAVQITAVGDYLASGFVTRARRMVWDKETGEPANKVSRGSMVIESLTIARTIPTIGDRAKLSANDAEPQDVRQQPTGPQLVKR
jgi:hypothetical protein